MKTECVCGICGHIITGNSKFRTEEKMWNEHIRDVHKDEYCQFLIKRTEIRKKIDELQKQIPSLYSTTYQGMTSRGSWTI